MPTPGLPNLDHYDLHSLADLVRPCRRCKLCEQRRQTVFGDGNPEAELMFIGEGPGADEDAQGIPFVGESGELLNRIIQAMTYSREEVYIANIVKCRPPGNRNPEPAEIAACLPYLHRQIALVRPKVLVLLGAVPLRGLIDDRCRITRDRGVWMEYDGIPVMPTFHPAYILRVPKAKREVWTDMQAVMQLLGRGPASGG